MRTIGELVDQLIIDEQDFLSCTTYLKDNQWSLTCLLLLGLFAIGVTMLMVVAAYDAPLKLVLVVSFTAVWAPVTLALCGSLVGSGVESAMFWTWSLLVQLPLSGAELAWYRHTKLSMRMALVAAPVLAPLAVCQLFWWLYFFSASAVSAPSVSVMLLVTDGSTYWVLTGTGAVGLVAVVVGSEVQPTWSDWRFRRWKAGLKKEREVIGEGISSERKLIDVEGSGFLMEM